MDPPTIRSTATTPAQVRGRIFYDVFALAAVGVLGSIYLHAQSKKYLRFRTWPVSEHIALAFLSVSLAILVAWVILCSRERAELVNYLEGDYDASYVPPPMTVFGQKMKFFTGYGYFVGIWGVKCAFLACYWKLIPTFPWKVTVLLYVTAAYTAATFLGNVLLHTLSCRPVSVNWSGGEDRPCFSYAVVPNLTVLAATNISSDLLLMLIPLLILKTFSLQPRERYSLAFIFLIGGMSPVAMALRYGFAWREDSDPNIYDIDENEYRKIFVTVESTCAGAAFCLPACRSLGRKLFADGRWWQWCPGRRWRGARMGAGGSKLEGGSGDGLGRGRLMQQHAGGLVVL